jgi:integrase
VLLAAWTGARWGELVALTLDRVDLVAGQMRIDRHYVLLKAEGDQPARVVMQSPKTEAGRRTVHIPPHLLPVLAAHLLEDVPPGCQLVFPNDHGEPLHRGSFTTVWHRAGLPSFHFHDLRHTGSTLAATTGASTRELMARKGHASMRAAVLHQHATSEPDREIAVALSELAQQRRPPSTSVVRLFPAVGEWDGEQGASDARSLGAWR